MAHVGVVTFGEKLISKACDATALSELDLWYVQEPKRSFLGGVRKAPGGGSSILSMKDLHPGTPVQAQPGSGQSQQDKPAPIISNERHPGGKATFGFGW